MQKTSQQPNDELNRVPQPIRGNEGGTDPGPRNVPLDRQNPDILTPPGTDSGTLPNMKFSFGLAAQSPAGRGLGTAGDSARVAHRHHPGRREYAAQSGRGARVALAQ